MKDEVNNYKTSNIVAMKTKPTLKTVSIIIPIYNGERWIDECFQSILNQNIFQNNSVQIEISAFNDSSKDRSLIILEKWRRIINDSYKHIDFILTNGNGENPKGVGFAKNMAVKNSRGQYLCFQDVDDIMLPNRLSVQLDAAEQNPDAIIGSRFRRDPIDATKRYSFWANNLSFNKLKDQIYTSHGPTVIMPTWFCHRNVYNRIGGFSELGKGTPEDLIFFYNHLDIDGDIVRVEEELIIYRYHINCTTYTIPHRNIWDLRIKRLENKVLFKWTTFGIWNAGKQGKRLYNSLSVENQEKVVAFCDVDKKKIGKFYNPYNSQSRSCTGVKIPIVHFTKCTPPLIICVKLDLSEGEFEANLNSLHLVEGLDYILFS